MNKGICKFCSSEFQFKKSVSKGFYCNNKCQMSFQRQAKVLSGKACHTTIRNYILEMWEYKCSCCGVSEWMGSPITLQMDHIDGNSKNNVLENVRWLCPNCHSQTDNWGVSNVSEEGRKRLSTMKGR